MKLKVTTSHYVLEVEEARFKLRQHTARVKDQETWLNARQGDLAHSTIKVVANTVNTPTVYFDGRDIGYINHDDFANIDSLCDLITYYNTKLGPTDLQTARIATLLSKGRKLAQKTNKLKVFTATWNMFGALASLSPEKTDELVDYTHDVIVLNFQESDPLNRNLVANQNTLQSTIEKFSRTTHTLASSVQLLGLMTLVFVRQGLRVSNVQKESSGVGFLRVWGNKGAVLTKFTLLGDDVVGGGAEFVLVNCHLSAGEKREQNQRRQWELREISKKFNIKGVIKNTQPEFETAAYEFDADKDSVSSVSDTEEPPSRYRRVQDFGIESDEEVVTEDNEKSIPPIPEDEDTKKADKSMPEKPMLETPTDNEETPGEKPLPSLPETSETEPPQSGGEKLPQFIIFAGDLNYRVHLDMETVTDLAKKGKYRTILENDYCTKLKNEKLIFIDFQEAPITFSPTYKYQLGSHKYDSSLRTPSYTDRIFYAGDLEFEINQYTSKAMTLSDHRPVVSQAQVKVQSRDWDAYEELVDSAYRMVDRAENLTIPNVVIEPNTIEVESPIFSIPCEAVVIKSESNRPVSWHVLPNEKLHVSPDNGILEPNSSQRLLIKTFMAMNIAEINEIIVVAVEGGADRFISAIFRRGHTFIGDSIQQMCKKGEHNDNLPQTIWQCVDYLWSRVVPQIFVGEGELSIIRQAIEWLDNGKDLDIEVLDVANRTTDGTGSTSIARVLYLILTNMPEPIIPYNTVRDIEGKVTDEALLDKIPAENTNVAIYILSFFRHAIDFGCPFSKIAKAIEQMLMGRSDDPEEETVRQRVVNDLFN